MAERPVVNASPLIFLARAKLLHLLQLAGPELVVPQSVSDEIGQRGSADSAARAIAETKWLEVIPTPPIPSVIQAWGLGMGESSVLAWAYARPGTEAILDDLAARRCAATFGVPVRGTLGLDRQTARTHRRCPPRSSAITRRWDVLVRQSDEPSPGHDRRIATRHGQFVNVHITEAHEYDLVGHIL